MTPRAVVAAGLALIFAVCAASWNLGPPVPVADALAGDMLCLLACWLIASHVFRRGAFAALAIVLSLAAWVGIVWAGLWLTAYVSPWWLRVAFTVETFGVLSVLVVRRC